MTCPVVNKKINKILTFSQDMHMDQLNYIIGHIKNVPGLPEKIFYFYHWQAQKNCKAANNSRSSDNCPVNLTF